MDGKKHADNYFLSNIYPARKHNIRQKITQSYIVLVNIFSVFCQPKWKKPMNKNFIANIQLSETKFKQAIFYATN